MKRFIFVMMMICAGGRIEQGEPDPEQAGRPSDEEAIGAPADDTAYTETIVSRKADGTYEIEERPITLAQELAEALDLASHHAAREKRGHVPPVAAMWVRAADEHARRRWQRLIAHQSVGRLDRVRAQVGAALAIDDPVLSMPAFGGA
jgi:hypothetical protein